MMWSPPSPPNTSSSYDDDDDDDDDKRPPHLLELSGTTDDAADADALSVREDFLDDAGVLFPDEGKVILPFRTRVGRKLSFVLCTNTDPEVKEGAVPRVAILFSPRETDNDCKWSFNTAPISTPLPDAPMTPSSSKTSETALCPFVEASMTPPSSKTSETALCPFVDASMTPPSRPPVCTSPHECPQNVSSQSSSQNVMSPSFIPEHINEVDLVELRRLVRFRNVNTDNPETGFSALND